LRQQGTDPFTQKDPSPFEKLEKPKYYAEIRWTVEDVIDVAAENGVTMSEEEAKKFWKENDLHLRDKLLEQGKEYIEDILTAKWLEDKKSNW